jgi:hypothetical protein
VIYVPVHAADAVAGRQGHLVAGSWDTLLSVWPLAPYTGSKDAAILPAQPSHYLHGHGDRVTAVAACSHLNAVASASAGGLLLLHHLPSARVLLSISGLPSPATLLQVSPLQPAVIAYCGDARQLCAWHVQGHALATARVKERLAAMAVSECGRLLVVAGEPPLATNGEGGRRSGPQPALLWVHSLKVRHCLYRSLLPASLLLAPTRLPLQRACRLLEAIVYWLETECRCR